MAKLPGWRRTLKLSGGGKGGRREVHVLRRGGRRQQQRWRRGGGRGWAVGCADRRISLLGQHFNWGGGYGYVAIYTESAVYIATYPYPPGFVKLYEDAFSGGLKSVV